MVLETIRSWQSGTSKGNGDVRLRRIANDGDCGVAAALCVAYLIRYESHCAKRVFVIGRDERSVKGVVIRACRPMRVWTIGLRLVHRLTQTGRRRRPITGDIRTHSEIHSSPLEWLSVVEGMTAERIEIHHSLLSCDLVCHEHVVALSYWWRGYANTSENEEDQHMVQGEKAGEAIEVFEIRNALGGGGGGGVAGWFGIDSELVVIFI